MKTTNLIAASALAAAFAAGGIGLAFAGPAAVPGFKFDKCYGIAKASANDCQTASHSCAGQSTKDAQADSWIYVPAGTCSKIVGGTTKS
jgi:uncharacterized membrane protein